MSIFLPESEDIYFSKTREYFQEVLSSYANGNYRSANVMLYSVAICDILFKLQELRDMYNDSVATEILESYKINSEDKSAKSKSAWEKDFIDSVYKKTELLTLEAYTHINHLYDDRNFSAHPALNENYELITPSQETTIANIKNILEDILIKPPIFVTKVFDLLLQDLAEKKTIFEHDKKELTVYLNNKYFSRMPLSMKKSVFRSLWKLCFNLPENEDCSKNRLINREALEVLSKNEDIDIESIISSEKQFYTVAHDNVCEMFLIVYMSRFLAVYSLLERDVQAQINLYIEQNYDAEVISWFRESDFVAHIDRLMHRKTYVLYEEVFSYLTRTYKYYGCFEKLLDFYIYYYGESTSYNSADSRYYYAIYPYLDDFSEYQFLDLFNVINGNNQIYNRNQANSSNTNIIKKFIEKYGYNYNQEDYPNIVFDNEVLTPPFDDSEQNDIDEPDLPF